MLDKLASALLARFEHQGNDRDLDDAITLWEEFLPTGHHHYSAPLNHLAIALMTRFQRRGNDKDLDDAITLYRERLYFGAYSDQDRSASLINLARALATQFKHQGNDELLDEAIVLSEEALNLQSVGHPHRIASLNNLATMLAFRFKHSHNHQDLDEAVALCKKALDLPSDGHMNRLELLVNLSDVLSVQFTHQGNIHSLDEALENACSALSLLRTHDPRRSTVHRLLATIHMLFYESRLHSTGEGVDSLNAAMGDLRAGVDSIPSGLRSRLQTSLLWIRSAEKYTHSTLPEAYATSIQLLDDYISATASVSSRRHMMRLFPPTLAVGATSCALRHDEVCRAVELLEQGRTLIWTQMARFRVPIEGLQERGDRANTLVKKFRELSYLLDKPSAKLHEGTPRLIVDAEAVRYTGLVDDWKKTVEEIRKLEGFSRFMLPPLFSDLQDAARDGPVIVLIASESSRNAIIIPRHHSPINVQLATSVEKLERWVNTLQRIVRREAGPEEAQTKLIETLRGLWDDVVCPVVEHLGRFAPPGSRIWWCPTSLFNFLPLHAAGEYRRGGKNLSKLYISSYTASLTALIGARERHDRPQPTVPFAAIGQNHPPGYPFSLPSVEPELELVRSLLPPAPTISFTKVTSVESTKSRALDTLRDNQWLHFACHGTQNLKEPFKSAFLMRDEPLTLLDITQTNLSRHEFAFLSACETAVGDFETPDEVIHLAAALQFAGVKSVIGTFWKANDSTGNA
jgi:tetratricopeptide (TPR) repeat protein